MSRICSTAQLPSRYDFTSHYDLLVFRRLAQHTGSRTPSQRNRPQASGKRPGPPILQRIDTSPVGFAVFERVLLSVHPDDCAVREAYASRLLNATGDKAPDDPRSAGARGIPA
jgi:magnesium transporter